MKMLRQSLTSCLREAVSYKASQREDAAVSQQHWTCNTMKYIVHL